MSQCRISAETRQLLRLFGLSLAQYKTESSILFVGQLGLSVSAAFEKVVTLKPSLLFFIECEFFTNFLSLMFFLAIIWTKLHPTFIFSIIFSCIFLKVVSLEIVEPKYYVRCLKAPSMLHFSFLCQLSLKLFT